MIAPMAQGQTWIEQGPGSVTGGQVEGMAAQSNPVYGAVHRIAASPTDPNTVFIGAVNGGVWRTTNATAANPSWTPVTDFLPSLSTGALVFDQSNSNTLYLGAGKYSSLSSSGGARAGMFTSTDGGSTWSAVAGNSAFTAGGANISGIVANGQTILVTVDASDSNSYSDIGVWRSTNGGQTFTHLGSAAGLSNRKGTAIVADPTNSNRYYLAVHGAATDANRGVYRSDDGGATWTQMHDAAMDAIVGSSTGNMKVTVNNNGALFVGIVNSGKLAGVFRTTDQGGSFTSFGIPTTTDGGGNPIVNGIHPGGQGGLHFSMLADPTNNDVLYIGGDRQPLYAEVNNVSAVGATNYTGRLFRSSGPGAWTAITNNQTVAGSSPHADSRALAFDANGNLLEGDDGGFYRRSSPGNSTGDWTSAAGSGATGLRVSEVHSVAYDNHGGIAMIGTQDTGCSQQSAAGSQIWNSLTSGDGGVVGVYDRAGAANSYRYSSSQNLGGFKYRTYNASGAQVGGSIYPALSVNGGGGLSLTQFEPAAFEEDEEEKASVPEDPYTPGVPFYTKYGVNKVDAGRLVFGTRSLYETSDHGATLECLGGITGGAPTVRFGSAVNAVVYGGFKGAIGHADVLYTGAGTELRIRPAGGGFNVLPTVDAAYNAAAGASGFSITDVVLDYTDWDTAFVADSFERVYLTQDAGASWAQIPGLSGVIGNELETLEYIEHGSARAVFAGGLNGVFYSIDTGSGFGAWTEFGGLSLPNAKVRDLDYDPVADVLVVGLQGRGVWDVPNASSFVTPEPGTISLLVVGSLVLRLTRRRQS
ncbi:MAG: sialidase family protein [Planctomycetota bacterium]|nr:sialidase family protein [Planctomycetota bacterium]